MQRSPEAVSIRCRRCGGSFGFLPRPGQARCPYCAFEQPVSAELLAELTRYAGAVDRELVQADEAYRRAASWQQWSEQSTRNVPRLKVIIPAASAFTLLVCVAIPVSQELGMPPEAVRLVVAPLLVLPGVFLMGYLLWAYTGGRPGAKRAAAGRIPVACPNCGAKSELFAGAASQVCAFCKTALIASRPVIERGVNAAELSHLHARLEEFRQERLGMVGLSRYDMTAYLPFIVGGSFLLPLGGSTLGFSYQMLTGGEPYTPAIFILWVMFLGVLGFISVTLLHRHSRRARYLAALAHLGHQFPLRPLTEATELVGWLNQYWPAKYEVQNLTAGPYFIAASLDVLGCPALLNAYLGGDREPRLHLLVAAYSGLGSGQNAGSAAALARAVELGFVVSASEAGFSAVANEQTLRTVRRTPEALHLVAPVFAALAHAAHARRG